MQGPSRSRLSVWASSRGSTGRSKSDQGSRPADRYGSSHERAGPHAPIGTWSGGRFLHFGEAIDEERLEALLRPGDGIDTLLTADAYGQGEADELLGRALTGVRREDY